MSVCTCAPDGATRLQLILPRSSRLEFHFPMPRPTESTRGRKGGGETTGTHDPESGVEKVFRKRPFFRLRRFPEFTLLFSLLIAYGFPCLRNQILVLSRDRALSRTGNPQTTGRNHIDQESGRLDQAIFTNNCKREPPVIRYTFGAKRET